MYSTISRSKFGDCFQCGDKGVDCAKVGKHLYCITKCHRDNKTKQQIAKANQKTALRGLIKYERAEGILDSVQELTLDLDRVISRYIRLRDMEKDGKITCYCCRKRVAWQKAHCMHFIPRQHLGTRFLTDNLRSGCFTCNIEKRGNLEVFAERLKAEEFGLYEFLIEQSHEVANPTRDELKQLLFDYQQKLHIVEKKLC